MRPPSAGRLQLRLRPNDRVRRECALRSLQYSVGPSTEPVLGFTTLRDTNYSSRENRGSRASPFHVQDFATTADKRNLDTRQCATRRKSPCQTQSTIRQRNDGHLASLRSCRHQQSDRLAKAATEPRYLTRMSRVDDASLAFGSNHVVAELRHNIAKPRLGMDSNGLGPAAFR